MLEHAQFSYDIEGHEYSNDVNKILNDGRNQKCRIPEVSGHAVILHSSMFVDLTIFSQRYQCHPNCCVLTCDAVNLGMLYGSSRPIDKTFWHFCRFIFLVYKSFDIEKVKLHQVYHHTRISLVKSKRNLQFP